MGLLVYRGRPTLRAQNIQFPAVVNSSSPLDNFPLVRSRDIEDVRAALARVYTKPALVPTPGVEHLNAALNSCRLGRVTLAYSTYGSDVGLEYPPTDLCVQLFPIRGTAQMVCGRISDVLTPGASAVVCDGAPYTMKYGADYEHLVLRISSRLLTEKLVALTGATIKEPLRMDPQRSSKRPAALMLQRYLPRLVDTLSEAHPPFPDWWIAQTEEFLVTLFLCAHRHNYSHLLEEPALDVAPGQIRQAEEYMEANAPRVVTLEELAEITGVSAFSLYSAFKKHRGYSPFEFLSRVRSKSGGAHR